MKAYSLFQVSDGALSKDLSALVSRQRATTAELLAHLAEFDARRLYAPAGYPSMFAYCVQVLRFSDDSAGKRIHAARTARRFPAIFEMVADGRLHLSAVCMLARSLTSESAAELLAAASHRTKTEIEYLIACRNPRPDVAAQVQAVAPELEHAPGHAGLAAAPPEPGAGPVSEHAPYWNRRGQTGAGLRASARTRPGACWVRDAARSPSAHRAACARALRGPVHDRTEHVRVAPARRRPGRAPAQLRRDGPDLRARAPVAYREHREAQVWRDRSAAQELRAGPRPRGPGGRQARSHGARRRPLHLVSETGTRCDSRRHLEFDHVVPVALGGKATVLNLRLRCSAHNQLEADRVFGSGFMERKRERMQPASPAIRARVSNSASPPPG